MSDNVYLNADRSAVVSEFDPGKKWQVRRKEAHALGLLSEEEPKPQARRTSADDTTRKISEPAPDRVVRRSTPKSTK